MFELIIGNLELVGYAVGLLALAMLSNTCFGLWHNIKQLKLSFSWSKLFDSLLKFLVFAIGLSSISILITLLPIYLQYSGVDISDEVLNLTNIVVVITIFIKSIVSYTKQAIEKLREILDGSGINGE